MTKDTVLYHFSECTVSKLDININIIIIIIIILWWMLAGAVDKVILARLNLPKSSVVN